jgi:hypothetical protein
MAIEMNESLNGPVIAKLLEIYMVSPPLSRKECKK